ncbi:MAG: hypothetical protein JO147_09325 [Actinobacteria bacterium]|nr:hypothetical protein [Actinomycetota bacterium]
MAVADVLPSRTVDCGVADGSTAAEKTAQKLCGSAPVTCPPLPSEPAPHSFIYEIQLGTQWIPQDGWCPGQSTPTPVGTTLRQEITRLLPEVGIGAAPSGDGLDNFETIFNAATPAVLALGGATLLGVPVQLQASFHSATWNFGDHTGDKTTSDPGTAWAPGLCDTDDCPNLFGHTWTKHGTYPVTLTITWTGQFRVAGSDWISIPTPITGPTHTITYTVHEAYSSVQPGR